MIYGARVVIVDGNFDEALAIVRELRARHPLTIVNSINPYRLEGQKTAAFEVCDALGDAPDYWPSRWATRATSPPTGGAFASIRRSDGPPGPHG